MNATAPVGSLMLLLHSFMQFCSFAVLMYPMSLGTTNEICGKVRQRTWNLVHHHRSPSIRTEYIHWPPRGGRWMRPSLSSCQLRRGAPTVISGCTSNWRLRYPRQTRGGSGPLEVGRRQKRFSSDSVAGNSEFKTLGIFPLSHQVVVFSSSQTGQQSLLPRSRSCSCSCSCFSTSACSLYLLRGFWCWIRSSAHFLEALRNRFDLDLLMFLFFSGLGLLSFERCVCLESALF